MRLNMKERKMNSRELIQRIKDALGTDEDGEALIEVARNAHTAEQVLAAEQRARLENSHLVIGQCPDCFEINRHAQNCPRVHEGRLKWAR